MHDKAPVHKTRALNTWFIEARMNLTLPECSILLPVLTNALMAELANPQSHAPKSNVKPFQKSGAYRNSRGGAIIAYPFFSQNFFFALHESMLTAYIYIKATVKGKNADSSSGQGIITCNGFKKKIQLISFL